MNKWQGKMKMHFSVPYSWYTYNELGVSILRFDNWFISLNTFLPMTVRTKVFRCPLQNAPNLGTNDQIMTNDDK